MIGKIDTNTKFAKSELLLMENSFTWRFLKQKV